MAQVDTGLGWSAKDEYLVLSAQHYMGAMTEISAPGYTYQPLKYAITAPEYPTSPTYIQNSAGGGNIVYKTYYVSATANATVFVFRLPYNTGDTTISVYFVSNLNGAIGRTALYRNAGSSLTTTIDTVINNLDSVTGLYYAIRPASGFSIGIAADTLPIFATLADGLAAISILTKAYYKLNAGYAVGCFAKWYTMEGNTLVSPILISSADAATVPSNDGIQPAASQTSSNFLRDGVWFRMTLIPGIDGDTAVISADATVPIVDLTPYGAAAPSKIFAILASESFANILIVDPPDPYEINPSEEGGGDGEDIEDDPVDEQTNPLPSVAGLGFCTVYVPSQMELLAMSSYLWSGNFDVSQVIKLFSNPLDSIIGLSAVPVDLVGTSEQIYLGGVALTGVTMPRYTGRTAVKVDMGTATISKRYGAYLDYDPYTEFSIYVPFVGIKNLKADDIMEKTISLMYDIDILTGACVAYLRTAGGSVLYEWAGQCAQQIPVTGSNLDNMFQNAVSAATALGGALLAPTTAPVLAGAVASAAVQAVAAKPRVERSGALTGVSGWLGQLRPYIIRTTPEAYIPADQNKFIGYPAYINVSMGDISGYNEISSVHLENIPATGDELAEIESLLKGGVIF